MYMSHHQNNLEHLGQCTCHTTKTIYNIYKQEFSLRCQCTIQVVVLVGNDQLEVSKVNQVQLPRIISGGTDE